MRSCDIIHLRAMSQEMLSIWYELQPHIPGANELKSPENHSCHISNCFNFKICALLWQFPLHYSDVTMNAMASQITNLTIVCSTVYSGADQRKHQSSESLVFVRGIHRSPVNSPNKWPVTRKMFLFDDVIMEGLSPGKKAVCQHTLIITTESGSLHWCPT